jgi:hypothetical protein
MKETRRTVELSYAHTPIRPYADTFLPTPIRLCPRRYVSAAVELAS